MEAEAHPWTRSSSEVVENFKSDSEQGLTLAQVNLWRARYGSNSLLESKRTGGFKRLIRQFNSPVILTLLLATVVSAALGESVDAIAIAAIVLLNACIGFYQEGKAEAAIDALRKMSVPKARVIRNGETHEIPSEQIVPGDILVLEAGDFIAADARILNAQQLSTDESVLTGESLPVSKHSVPITSDVGLADRKNMLFSGTAVATGSARAVAVATGMNSEIGKIAGLISAQKQDTTPLQDRLKQVSQKLLWACAAVVFMVAAIGFIRGTPALELLIASISLAVAAIPEGLPAVVTLALALAVRRMVKRNAIVRNLTAVETLGATTVICTDKTGTLTTGKMRVREVFTLKEGIEDINQLKARAQNAPSLMIEAGILCSNASLARDGHSTGDPTEVALLHLAVDVGFDPEKIRGQYRRLFEWTFDSDRKRMTVAVEKDSRRSLMVKGAAEAVLPLCQLPEMEFEKIENAVKSLSSQGRRLLAIATRENFNRLESIEGLPIHEVETSLRFLGLVSIADPPRVESIKAIEKCKAAGIKVVMITGDHPITARAIAQELGIMEPGKLEGVVSGSDIENLSDTELKDVVTKTAVYARVSPEHKLRIVNAWKNRGEIVAMTGDGVNDAPALKAASIGLAMGRGGTEVARQASGMILADDNFATIVSGIEEGRGIFGNISRTIQYLLSGNFAEILIMFGAAVAGWPIPLAPIHLLWINLVTDGVPALALAAEPIPKDILSHQSRPSARTFFTRAFYGEVLLVGSVTAGMALLIYSYTLPWKGELVARTYLFTFVVFAELFRSFASRSQHLTFFQLGALTNPAHLAAVAFPILFQFSLHHSTWFGEIFKVTTISWSECFALLGLTLIPVTLLEVRKLLPVLFTGRKV